MDGYNQEFKETTRMDGYDQENDKTTSCDLECSGLCHNELVDFINDLQRLDSTLSNKQLRFKCYRFAANFMFFTTRKQLPHCVTTLIQKAFPESNQSMYVGFKETRNQ
jgi:hypothetical protein